MGDDWPQVLALQVMAGHLAGVTTAIASSALQSPFTASLLDTESPLERLEGCEWRIADQSHAVIGRSR